LLIFSPRCALYFSFDRKDTKLSSDSILSLEKLTNRHEKGRDAAVLPAVTIDLTKVTWTVATAVMSTDIVQ